MSVDNCSTYPTYKVVISLVLYFTSWLLAKPSASSPPLPQKLLTSFNSWLALSLPVVNSGLLRKQSGTEMMKRLSGVFHSYKWEFVLQGIISVGIYINANSWRTGSYVYTRLHLCKVEWSRSQVILGSPRDILVLQLIVEGPPEWSFRGSLQQ